MLDLNSKADGTAWNQGGFAAKHPSNGEPTVAAVNLELLASLSHEIRTPLSGILGMTDLLLESGLTGEQEEYVAAARDCAESLFDLLNATLEYSSLQTGCIRLETTEFQPADLVDGVVSEAASRVRARGMELRATLGEGLKRMVRGDAHRIRQLLAQVLRLAHRYGTGEAVSFSADLAEQDGRVVMEVEVRCHGSALTMNGAMSGAELAVAVVEGFLKLLGGGLTRGAGGSDAEQIFKMAIPLQPSAVRGRSSSVRDAGRAEHAPTILVVDDNRIAQQVIGALLNKHGWRYETAKDGYEAIAKSAKAQYQLVLMDLQMPGIDGLETTRRLRQLPGYAATPVLALTADVSDQVRVKCRDAGMDAFLEKPIHTVALNALLTQFLTSPDGD
jgi:CheY-like chemotaxis protein